MKAISKIVIVLVIALAALATAPGFAEGPAPGLPGWTPERFTAPPEEDAHVQPAQPPQAGPGVLITVTTTVPAANPGDGACSLIEAIDNANSDSDSSGGDCPAGAGPDTIHLAAAATYTLDAVHNATDGDNGLPSITTTVVVEGNGSIIERSAAGITPAFRLIHVSPGAELTLNDLTLRNGNSSTSDGGGIRNQGGTLTLNGCVVHNNWATGANSDGGGIFNAAQGSDATTMLVNSQVVNNSATVSGGGIYTIASSNVTATLTISNSLVSLNLAGEAAGGIRSTIYSGSQNYGNVVQVLRSEVSENLSSNSAGFVGGGGIVNNYAQLLIADSVVKGNRAETGSAYGGGLINNFGDATILRSAITHNVAASSSGPFPAGGGGVVNSDGTMVIANSTLSGNVVNGGASGGALLLVNFFGSAPSDVTVVNSTLSGNQADGAGGAAAAMDFAGGQPVGGAFVNTVVAYNPAGDGRNCTAMPGTVFLSGGHNLEDLDTCAFNQTGDLVNTDPMLGPLQNNGGPTETHALLPGSPAINGGDDGVCAAPPVSAVDQRGAGRPMGAACDIGAYEAESPPTAVRVASLEAAAAGAAPVPPAAALSGLLVTLAAGLAAAARRRRTILR